MIWAEKKTFKYKRSLTDGVKKCPYCNAQWNWSLDRDLEFYRTHIVHIKCSKCHRTFTWTGGHI